MKHIYLLFLLCLMPMLNSCGILDSGGGNPYTEYHLINRLYSINLANGSIKLITVGSRFSILQNGKILFLKNNNLYTCNPDGSDSLNIFHNNKVITTYQTASNGTKIIFEQYPSMYITNTDGSDYSRLNTAGNPGNFTSLIYSPDELKIAYANSTGLYITNYYGTNTKLIRNTSYNSYFPSIGFTPDGNNLIYIQSIQNKYARDLRLYNFISKKDTSLYYRDVYATGATSFSISTGNNLLFCDETGIKLLNLTDYDYHPIYIGGGDAHFSYDSSKITFIDFSENAIGLLYLNSYTVNLFPINLPGNIISGPTLSRDGKQIIFQADTSWVVY